MNDDQEKIIFVVAFFDAILFSVLLVCWMKHKICCRKKKHGSNRKKWKNRKGVEEGLHQMFKVAMHEKLEADKQAARLPYFSVKTVRQQEEAVHYDHPSPYRALKTLKIQQQHQHRQQQHQQQQQQQQQLQQHGFYSSENNSTATSPMTYKKSEPKEQEDDDNDEDNAIDSNPYMLKLSLCFSNGSLILLLHELFGIPNKASGGYDLVRISITLLPEKQHQRQTRSLFVGTEGPLVLGEIFRFFDVDPDSLISSFFRFRLFADSSSEVECCIGEMDVELCGVLDSEDGFEVWKEFQRKKMTKVKSTPPEHSDDDNIIHQ